MSSQKYQLVFSGKLLQGFKHSEVNQSLSSLLKIPLDQAGHLIQGDRFRIKTALEKEKAERLLEKITQRGAECSVEPVRREANKRPVVKGAEETPAPPLEEPDTVLLDGSEVLTLDFPPPQGVEDKSAPLTLDLPEITPEDDQTRPLSTVGDAIVMATPADVAEFKPEDDSSNVGTFYEGPVKSAPKESPKPEAAKKKQLYMLLGGLAGLAVVAWLLMPMLLEEVAEPVVSTAPVVPVDPKRAITVSNLDQLNRSVNVWMIQYGSGFNPTQVTLDRLQQDLGISDQDMVDGWGTALRFEPEAQVYRVKSAGPDKAFGTGDDLKRETSTVRK